MTGLTLALKITGDGGELRTDLKLDEAALQKLGVTTGQVEAEARRASAGMGALETQTRQAASAARAQVDAVHAQAAAIDSYGDRLDAMRTKFNPFVALQKDFLAQQQEINHAVRQGGISELEGERALERTRGAYARNLNALRASTAASRAHTGAVKLQGWQVANLGQQLQDVGVQLSMGTSPFIILAQQGPQITSAMGGVKNALALVAPYFTVTTVAVGTLTAGVLTGAAAWNSYLKSVKAVEAAAAGRGRSLGIAPGDLEAIATAGADAANISRKSAREAEIAFLNTGRIGQQTMQGLISISRDYAATMGIDVSSAITELADRFKDPAKGAKELQKDLDLLDDRTLRYVETLVRLNRQEEARIVLLSRTRARTQDAKPPLTALGEAWDWLSKHASNAFDTLGKGVDEVFYKKQASQIYLDQLTAIRNYAQQHGQDQVILQGVGIIDMKQLDSEIQRVESKLSQLRRDAANDNLNRASVRAGETARSLIPGLTQLDQLRGQRADLSAALQNPDVAARADNLRDVATAWQGVTHAIESYLTPAEKARRNDELAIQALTAKTPAEKAQIATQQKRLELAGQSISATEAEAQAQRAGRVAFLTATQAIRDQNDALALNSQSTLDVASAYLRSADAALIAQARRQGLSDALQTGANAEAQARLHLRDAIAAQAETGAQSLSDLRAQVASQTRVNDAVLAGTQTQAQANAQSQTDAAIRQLVIARNVAEGEAKETLTRIIDGLRGAYARLNEEQSRAAAASILQDQKDELETLRAQRAAIGRSAEARAVSTAVLQAEQQARRAGVDMMSEELARIREGAAVNARATVEIERQQAAYDELSQIGQSALDNLSQKIAENGLSWSTLADVASSALQDIESELLKLSFTNPLKNALFGTNSATLSDAGGIIGSLFHSGGIVGQPTNDNRVVPASVFAGAQRRHMGGLASDEVPIIAKKREEILTEDNPRHIFNYGRGGQANAPAPRIEFHIHEAPGTKTETRTSQNADGSLRVDTFVRSVDDKLAGGIRSGQSSVGRALEQTYGLKRQLGA